jgi:hypothetical protein
MQCGVPFIRSFPCFSAKLVFRFPTAQEGSLGVLLSLCTLLLLLTLIRLIL